MDKFRLYKAKCINGNVALKNHTVRETIQTAGAKPRKSPKKFCGHSTGPKDVTSADNRGRQTDSLTDVIIRLFCLSK
jgi:hypothetical protein